MTHTPHEDIHTYGLADGCPRCSEFAERPLLLDARNLRTLVERTLRNRFGSEAVADDGPAAVAPFGEYAPARSDTEARAMAVVMTDLEHAGKLFEAAPTAVCLYLRERWGVRVSVDREET